MRENNDLNHQNAPQNQERYQERVVLGTGVGVIIDQFMLANAHYQEAVATSDENSVDATIQKFGGVVYQLIADEYIVHRDPDQDLIIIGEQVNNDFPEDGLPGDELGKVNIDTDYVLILDRKLAIDQEFLKKYRSYWRERNPKAARDLLRQSGGAVRHSFLKSSHQLAVYHDGQSITMRGR
jgi:hypothetical protein